MFYFRDLSFFFKEAFIGVFRSKLMFAISILTVSICLFLLGLFVMLNENLSFVSKDLMNKLEVNIYFKHQADDLSINELVNNINKLKGVKGSVFLDRETAWQSFKERHQQIPLAYYNVQNPLPNGLSVSVDSVEKIEPLLSYLNLENDLIDEVVYNGELTGQIQQVSSALKWLGIALLSLLFFASSLIVLNTIRLTVIARKEEIDIMYLVGAKQGFISYPILIEGALIGVLGGLIAILGLYVVFDWIKSYIDLNLPFTPLSIKTYNVYYMMLFIFSAGIVKGMLSAYISIVQMLNNKY